MALYPVQSDPAAQGVYKKLPQPIQSIVDFFTPDKASIPFSPSAMGMLGEGGSGLISRLLAAVGKQQGALKGAPAAVGAGKMLGPSSAGYLSSPGPVQKGIADTLENVLMKRGVDINK